ncbi:hypothetical protein MKX54_17150 [Alkalihalobacillus sp. FSL R5-0424]
MNKHAWLLRPLPHGNEAMQDFLDRDFVAVGYPLGLDLSDKTDEELKKLLEPKGWGEGFNNLKIVVKSMKSGDLVIVPDTNKKDVYFGTIESDYVYISRLDEDKDGSGYPHQRKVKWLFDKAPFPRLNLPEEIKSSLRYPGGVADISKHYEALSKLVAGDTNTKSSLDEKALSILEELLDHENDEIRLNAAIGILNYNK